MCKGEQKEELDEYRRLYCIGRLDSGGSDEINIQSGHAILNSAVPDSARYSIRDRANRFPDRRTSRISKESQDVGMTIQKGLEIFEESPT